MPSWLGFVGHGNHGWSLQAQSETLWHFVRACWSVTPKAVECDTKVCPTHAAWVAFLIMLEIHVRSQKGHDGPSNRVLPWDEKRNPNRPPGRKSELKSDGNKGPSSELTGLQKSIHKKPASLQRIISLTWLQLKITEPKKEQENVISYLKKVIN